MDSVTSEKFFWEKNHWDSRPKKLIELTPYKTVETED